MNEPSNVSGPRVRIGGLYRCCIQAIYEADEKGELGKDEGARLKCPYCSDSWMILRDGFWQWDSLYTEPQA